MLAMSLLLFAGGCSGSSQSDGQPGEPDRPGEQSEEPDGGKVGISSCGTPSDSQTGGGTPSDSEPGEREDDPATDQNLSGVTRSEVTAHDERAGGDVKVGQLRNGLTYYVDSNWTPHDALTLILAVKAGSLHESEPFSGVAHFVEHMMFNGTEAFPGNSIFDEVREFGLEFGPDLNAVTTYDNTIYFLTGLSDDPSSVETGFKILSQWAHAATITPEAVEQDRGVIRDEYRLRSESSQGVANDASLRLLTDGTPYEQRPPKGDFEGIEDASAADLTEFYDTWYVPSNMALVAVGDLTDDELKELTEKYFGSIPAHDPPPAPATNSLLRPESRIEVIESPAQVDPLLSLYLQVPAGELATAQGQRTEQLDLLLANAINGRLRSAYDQGLLSLKSPLLWSYLNVAAGLRYHGTGLISDDLAQTVGDVWGLLQGLATHGFGEDDLVQAKAPILSELQLAADNVEVTFNTTYAFQYANHFLRGTSLETSPERLERVSAVLETIEPDELTRHLRSMLAQSGPIISVVAADVTQVPTASEIQEALDSASATEPTPVEVLIDRLIAAPDPVEPISQGPIADLEVDDAVEWSFANGARVNLNRSHVDGFVQIEAVSLGGWSTLEAGDRPLAEVLAPTAVAQSGLAGLTPTQIAQQVRTTQVFVRPFITETTEGFTGYAPSGEAETLFALLHLLICEPQIDDQAFNSVVSSARQQASRLETSPMSNESVAYNEARFGDQIAWFHPVASQETLDELTAESLLEIYLDRLGKVDGLLVAISGDLDESTAERLAKRYIGTLPAGEPDTFTNRRPAHPQGIVLKEVVLADDTHTTGITLFHETLRPIDAEGEAALDVLQAVLNARLLSDIREDIGESYEVSATLSVQFTPEAAFVSEINASGAPGSIEEIRAEIIRILAELATRGPSDSEFREGIGVVDLNYQQSILDLESMVRRIHTRDEDIATNSRLLSALPKVTTEDVQALAAELFGSDQHIEVTRVLS